MRVGIPGATGNIGRLADASLGRAGHDVVRISRSLGVGGQPLSFAAGLHFLGDELSEEVPPPPLGLGS